MSTTKNIAIIAHVDHGKTTLVDKIMYHCHLFRDNENKGDLILDNNDLERERGITITSKNVSVVYKDTKINIIDTPGHADFGGEVERVLNMADGVLLLVDAFEGPMPQTRFVLQKAIDLGLKPCVVINKVDKQNCTPEEVHEKVFDLMFELGAEEWQLDFPVVYGSAKNNWMSDDWKNETDNIEPLLDMVIDHIPTFEPKEGNTQMLITSLDFSSFTGRIAIGRLQRGSLKEGQQISLVKRDGSIVKSKIKELFTFEGLGRKKVQEVVTGDICAIVGLEGFDIGDTIADLENPEGLKTIAIDEPTMSMLFTINDSPFFGKAVEMVSIRKGEMTSMEAKGNRMICEFLIPSRGIIGLRNQLLTATAGEAIMAHRFLEYQPMKGDIPQRQNGSLVSMEKGKAIPYSIDKLQDRGKFFVDPGEDIYEGQVIGENSRGDEMTVNITKTKKMSNVRSSGADDKAKIVPAIKFSLEEALEYIQKDEYVEVTPKHLRLRKIYLTENDRKRNKIV